MMNRKKITAFLTSLLLMGASVPAQGLMTANAETYEYLEYYVGGYYNWETDEYEQQIVIEGCDPSFSGDLVIPSEIGGLSVGRIDYSAFSGCTNLTSVTIPDSVTRIDWYAFQNCTNLTSVNIPESVTNLGGSVFRGCSSLTTVTLPNSMTEISNNAFRDCSSLTSVIIPDSVETIDSYAFANTGLTSITIPENVKTIGYSSFAGSALASVDILGSDTIICGFAFDACPNFTEMNISENNINYSFENGILYDKDKTVLKQYLNTNTAPEFTVPDTVKTIAGWAFDGNPYLTSVTVPDSVEKIAIYAFDHCQNLT